MRTNAIVAATLLVLLTACNDTGADPAPASSAEASRTTPPVAASPEPAQPSDRPGKPKRTASCGKVETIPEQSGSHLVGDTKPPVPYNSTPPTSGWHSSGAVAIGVSSAKDPLTEPEQVSVLEAGGVVISYRGLSDRDVKALRRLADGKNEGTVAVSPYGKLDRGEVAATAWGTLLTCKGVDAKALQRFVHDHAGDHAAAPGH